MSTPKVRIIFHCMPKTEKTYDARLELKLETELKAKAQQAATKRGYSTNAWVRLAMWEKIARDEKSA